MHLLPRDQHEWVLARAEARAPPSETTKTRTRTTKGHSCAERDAVLGVQTAHLRRNEKTQTGKTVQGRAICLVLDFMLKPLPIRSVMPILDADEIQALKLIPTAGKLISLQRHRCVIPQEIIHPVVTNCVLKLRPPTQVIRFINCDSVDVGTRCFVTNVLAVVNVDVGAVRC